MKKFAAVVLALVLSLTCAAAFAEGIYVSNSVYAEAGYENDCYNGVAKILIVNDDGTYTLIDNTSIIQVSYTVVTNWTYVVKGTYEVAEEEEGFQVLNLTAESATYTMNGSITTSEEDAEILEDYASMQVECDAEAGSLVVVE